MNAGASAESATSAFPVDQCSSRAMADGGDHANATAKETQVKERRKLKRRQLVYYLRVFDRTTEQLIGQIVDITKAGIMLVSEKPIETGLTFQLRMTLPKEIEGSWEIAFDAQALWCRADANPDFHLTGFQLVDLPDDQASLIEALIEELGFRD